MHTFGVYIDGEWQQTPNILKVMNPVDNSTVGNVAKAGENEALAAVHAAQQALDSWSVTTAYERANLLKLWYEAIEQEKIDIAKTLTMEQGKPLKEAISEIDYANQFILWYAEEAKRVYGETIPSLDKSKRIIVNKKPIGVVAAITPWNFPAAMITRKVSPALAAGCTVVIKPSELTPLTAYRLVLLADKVGFPKGVINIVTGDPIKIGDIWLNDKRVRKITFTGSTPVGKYLMKGASYTVKKVSLELGGHAPTIVLKDADLDFAAETILAGKFRNAGQTCVCPNRIYVQKEVVEKFIDIFSKKAKKLVVGNGLDEGVDMGPLISDQAVHKVIKQVQDAVDKGATLIGELPGSRMVKPIILTNVNNEMRCMNEETFGPLAPIMSIEDEEEAIRLANNSEYGLAAYVFTSHLEKAFKLSEALEYGIVGINDTLPSIVQAPFGGMKQSGIGREGGHHGLDEFLEIQYVSMKLHS